MTMLNLVCEALAQWPQPRLIGRRVIVPTQCITSGGDIIYVTVEGGENTFFVHDDGAALRIFENCGGNPTTMIRSLRAHIKPLGFQVSDEGVIRANQVGHEDLAATVALLANATRDAVEHILQRWKPEFKINFKDAVQLMLDHQFPKRVLKDTIVIGRSNKSHHFDFMVELPGEKQLVFDAVVKDANAITSAVVRHLDVANADNNKVKQLIVYDDRIEWKASDLNLLKIGAPPVAFTSMGRTLDKLAA